MTDLPANETPSERTWTVYVIECVDGSLYTGIALDVQQRFEAHRNGNGARYTRSHPPLRLLAHLPIGSRSAALKVECAIKRLRPQAKRALCADIAAQRLDAMAILAL